MKQTKNKILVAIDGSNYALDAVRYVSKIPSFQDMEVILFHVRSHIPESYWDLEGQIQYTSRLREIRTWEAERDRRVHEYMENAKRILWRVGFPKESVKVQIRDRKKGIARDIISEARRGYSCVIVGRRGMSKLKDLVLGSISTKLIEKIAFAPIVVVGKKPKPDTILVALDRSENSMRTVDNVGKILGGSDVEVALIHVIRSDEKKFIDKAMRRIDNVFEEAKGKLVKSGFKKNQVTTKIITQAHSRAGAIVQEAKLGGYGTIVVGRRGLSKVQDFIMGRVSNKVIHIAKNHAVWVVS